MCKLRTSSISKSPILGLCLGLVVLGSAGLVGLALQLWLGLALVLGLMPSVDMTYSRVCVYVCVGDDVEIQLSLYLLIMCRVAR